MITENKCPICGSSLKENYEDYFAGRLCEVVELCDKCDYYYEFSYGNEQLYAGSFIFRWGWGLQGDDLKKYRKCQKICMKIAQLEYKLFKVKTPRNEKWAIKIYPKYRKKSE